jgi:VWFA-related protein
MRIMTCVTAAFCLLLLSTHQYVARTEARATSSPGGTQSQGLVFRSGVNYVQLDVVVTDKDDKAVKDLTKNDFVISEHDRPQVIENAQFVSIPATHRTVTDLKLTVPTVDVFSNAHAPLGRQWVLVIDDLHIIELHILHTKNVVEEFLRSLPPEDQVAIVFVGRSDLSQDFTSDLGAQMRTVNRIKDALGFAYDANDTPQIKASVLAKRAADGERHGHAESTRIVLQNIAKALEKSTFARRAIVWVSEGMTYSRAEIAKLQGNPSLQAQLEAGYAQDFLTQLEMTFTAARRAGVPVYPIDPRGIPDCSAVRGPCNAPPMEKINSQWDNMHTLAEQTGGKAIYDRDDMAGGVRELIEDNSSFYLLGYYPDPFARDGQFHGVTVRVRNHPEYLVRARAGYTAPSAKAAGTATAESLDEVLSAALPVAAVPLRVFAAPVARGTRGMKTAITLEVSYPVLAGGARIDDTLHYGAVALDRDGKIKASTRHTFHFTASPKNEHDAIFVINDIIELPSQPLTLRVGVASEALGRAGSIYVPVEVINPSSDKLQMSTIVIGYAGVDRQAAVPPGVIKELIPFQPTTTRTFAPADTIRLFAPLTWGSNGASVDVTMTLLGGTNGPAHHEAVTATGHAPHVGLLDTTMSLQGFTPGPYTLEVVARLPNGQTARREIALEVK